jgi:UDP-N-acetylglucosamine 2-epimerase (non-hydrolysing)
MQLVHIVGARPNFMKVAPVMRALSDYSSVRQLLVHTGQHYDANMSDVFFEELDIPRPDVALEVGSASHAIQTAEIMKRFEAVANEQKPDRVLVYGDVNSTLAATLVCAKLQVPVGHVEAGLRSFDRTMPEEINRIVTDQLADLLLTPSPDADENLRREGIDARRVRRVGNVMIDTLVRLAPKARQLHFPELPDRFGLVTLHRPSNVDDSSKLREILETLDAIGQRCPLIFPIHPRTRTRIQTLHWSFSRKARVTLREPIGYLECLALQSRATFVITDSGGLQEETTFLGIPCLTLRENTERPITVEQGTNVLIGGDMPRLEREVARILDQGPAKTRAIELWDGAAAQRIAAIVAA